MYQVCFAALSALLLTLLNSKCKAFILTTDSYSNTASSPGGNPSFIDMMFTRMTDVCRVVMSIQYKADSEKEEMKKLFIVHLTSNSISTFTLENAFTTLMQPGYFDIRKPTKIVLHGFNDHAQSTLPMNIARAYMEKQTYNVMLLDCSRIIKQYYIRSVHMAKFIGRRLANLLANIENYGASAQDIHLIGISLGAQISGWTGKYFRKFKKKNIGRITGLDPAGPCYSFADQKLRLDKSDADYVDIVHVNRGVQGVVEPIGHADFFVNGGGPNQPGCFDLSCSHQRASVLFEESIKNNQSFIGVKCQSWNDFSNNKCNYTDLSVMGDGTTSSCRGLFYLKTSFRAPFGLGMEGIKKTTLAESLNEVLRRV